MDCAERGWIDAPGCGSATGRAARALDAIGDPARARRVARRGHAAGGRADRRRARGFAPHVKGLELPGYDPRALHTMALGLAVGTRGADHNRSGAYEADFSGGLDRRRAATRRRRRDRDRGPRRGIDSLILCKFLRGVFTDLYTESAALLAAVTGWDVDADELRTHRPRIVTAKQAFNLREGWPHRGHAAAPLPPRRAAGRRRAGGRVDARCLRAMIAAYYAARGLDESGRPDPADLPDLQLDNVVTRWICPALRLM